jgi:hypothetical protein
MTLGCGGWGGNITSDNISPKHLLNIKRLAYELRPATANRPESSNLPGPFPGPSVPPAGVPPASRPSALPRTPGQPPTNDIPADALAAKIDQFLASRGYKQDGPRPPGEGAPPAAGQSESGRGGAAAADVAEFVCEDDVRAAIKAGRKLVIGERTIVTPSARDLGEAQRVFVQSEWPR